MTRPSQLSTLLMESYLPADRWRALAAGVEIPEPTYGTALLAQISGFNILIESLRRTCGALVGAEQFGNHQNRVYTAVIAQLDAFGGSILNFSGDTLICWFDENFTPASTPDGEKPGAPRRAVAAGLEIIAAMRQFAAVEVPDGSKLPLSIRVAVASGRVQRLLVGDPQIQVMELAAGETMLRLVAAERLAQRGRLVVDEATVVAIGSPVGVSRWLPSPETGENFASVCSLYKYPSRCSWPDTQSAPSAEQVRPWLLPAVYESLVGGCSEQQVELRPAAALFLRFAGFDFEQDGTADRKLNDAIRWIQQIARRYNGAAVRLSSGRKSSEVAIAFGASHAGQNAVRQAASAAFELMDPPAGLGYFAPPQVGVAYGDICIGVYGGKTRRTFGMLGYEVNLAARLAQAARPGQILANGLAQENLGAAGRWETLAPLRLKGKSEPAAAAVLLSLTAE